MQNSDKRLLVQVLLSVLLIYGALWNNHEAPDLANYLFPWLAHIVNNGPIHGFATPFSNYTPPYLYLLSAASLLGLSPLATVKLLSTAGSLFLGWATWRLLKGVRPEKAAKGGPIVLLLPTVVINGPFLGQCDAIWVALAVLSVSAAVERRTYAMALWAGLSFAFKAQAVFLVPFAFAIIVRERKWAALTIPPAVYVLLVAPAWLAGWPLADLLTIYSRQYESVSWLSTAPNVWAVPQLVVPNPSTTLFVLGYAGTALACLVYVWRFPRAVLAAALLSSILVPWLMPKMHERYFLLADVLSLALAIADRRALVVFIGVQLGSLLSLVAYVSFSRVYSIHDRPFATASYVAGFCFMTAALMLLLRYLHGSQPAGAGLSARSGDGACKAHSDTNAPSGTVLGPA